VLGGALASLPEFSEVRRIVFPYTGGVHDEAALDVFILLAQHRPLEFTMLLRSAPNGGVQDTDSRVNVSLLQRLFASTPGRLTIKPYATDDLIESTMQELAAVTSSDYSLILMGYSSPITTVIQQLSLTALVIHTPTHSIDCCEQHVAKERTSLQHQHRNGSSASNH